MSLGREFGGCVGSLRRARGLTQEGLAERSDLSVDAIRRIERAAFSPSLNTIGKLCRGLDVSLRTLFEGFSRSQRNDVEQICDYLATRSEQEIRMTWRVIRAIFVKGSGGRDAQ